MDVAVVIPFRGDAEILAWTLEGFAQQELAKDVRVEVRLCADGGKVPSMPTAEDRVRFTPVESERVGVAEAKNILLRGRPADVVIFANSDTRPTPGFVMAHVRRLMSLPPGDLVLGSAPYEKAVSGSTVFDVLKEETPMVFFYPQMKAHERYDFRHCWTLNLSARYADLKPAGFFDSRFRPYGYEDIDLGYRLMGSDRKGIYFEPAAEVLHRHPMVFEDYLNREELLGVMMPVVFDANPELFAALSGGKGLEELAEEFSTWVEMDHAGHGWIYRRMQEWCGLSENALASGAARERTLMTIYQMHVPLKRWAFRLGFLGGMELRGDSRWKERVAAGLWRKAIGIQLMR